MSKLYKKEKFKTREDWLKHRGLGGSSASAIFGVNPYQSKLDIYCALTSKPNENTELDNEENEATIRGNELEPIIRAFVKQKFKKKFRVQSPNGYTQYRSKKNPFLTATLDGILTDIETGEKWILEIKTHSVLNREDALKWKDNLPQNYYIQCLHYLNVMNDFAGVILVANLIYTDFDTGLPRLGGVGDEIRYYIIDRNAKADDLATLKSVEEDFINQCVNEKIPPNISIEL